MCLNSLFINDIKSYGFGKFGTARGILISDSRFLIGQGVMGCRDCVTLSQSITVHTTGVVPRIDLCTPLIDLGPPWSGAKSQDTRRGPNSSAEHPKGSVATLEARSRATSDVSHVLDFLLINN